MADVSAAGASDCSADAAELSVDEAVRLSADDAAVLAVDEGEALVETAVLADSEEGELWADGAAHETSAALRQTVTANAISSRVVFAMTCPQFTTSPLLAAAISVDEIQ